MTRAALRVAGSLTLLRKRASSEYIGTGRKGSPMARPARHQCVFPSSDSLLSVLSVREHPAHCHSQVVAGIISLLNDFRLSQNMGTLGFLNPWLYGYGMGGLNDITSGRNPGCGTGGFPAASGWDPVSFTRLVSPLSMLTDSELNRSQVSGPLTFSNCLTYLRHCHSPSWILSYPTPITEPLEFEPYSMLNWIRCGLTCKIPVIL